MNPDRDSDTVLAIMSNLRNVISRCKEQNAHFLNNMNRGSSPQNNSCVQQHLVESRPVCTRSPSPKRKYKKSLNPPSERELLSEQISRASAENFELREQKVRLQHVSRLQEGRAREVKYRISLQVQRRERLEVTRRTMVELEDVVRGKMMEIDALRREIEAVKKQLPDDRKFIPDTSIRKSPLKFAPDTSFGKSPTRKRGGKSAEPCSKTLAGGGIPSENCSKTPSRMCSKSPVQARLWKNNNNRSTEPCSKTPVRGSSSADCSKTPSRTCSMSAESSTRDSKSAEYCKNTTARMWNNSNNNRSAESCSKTSARGSKSAESCRKAPIRGRKRSDVGSILSRLNGLLDELRDCDLSIEPCIRESLEEAEARIRCLLTVRADQGDVATGDRGGSPSDPFSAQQTRDGFGFGRGVGDGKRVKVEIFECFDKAVQVNIGDLCCIPVKVCSKLKPTLLVHANQE